MLNPEQKEQVGIDFVAAGFAKRYGGQIKDKQDFSRLYSGILMEAAHDLLGRKKIKVTNKPEQRQRLLSAVGQLYYFGYAAAISSAEDPSGQGSNGLWQRANGFADAVINAYPGARAQGICEGVIEQIGKNWPAGDKEFPADILGGALYAGSDFARAAETPSTNEMDALRRMNYYQTIDSVVLADGAIGARNDTMFDNKAEAASLGWLGKSAIGILSRTLPGKTPPLESINELARAYSSCIVNAKWLSQPVAQRNNIAISLADTQADETGAKLRAAFDGEELKKLAAVIYERATSGPKIAPADQVALKAYVYRAVGADLDDAAPAGKVRPSQGPKGNGPKDGSEPR